MREGLRGCQAAGGHTTLEGEMSNDDLRFDAVDGEAILRALLSLRICTWRYRWEPETTRHVGPSPEDFEAAFHLDGDERLINPLDASGVALAGVQALFERLERLEAVVSRSGPGADHTATSGTTVEPVTDSQRATAEDTRPDRTSEA